MSKHTKEQAEAIIAEWDKQLESAINGACEKAYWQFDARRKGMAEWKGSPQAERDAFKAECYMIAKRYILEPEHDVSQQLANDWIAETDKNQKLEQQNAELVDRIKSIALKHACEYPDIENCKTWEMLYAIEASLEGFDGANKDLHSIIKMLCDKLEISTEHAANEWIEKQKAGAV